MELSRLIVTQQGQCLIAAVISGIDTVQFSRMVTSSTEYAFADLNTLDVLTGIQQETPIVSVTKEDKAMVTIKGTITNRTLEEGYYFRTLGVYAKDSSEEELLYAVAVETTGNCYIPAMRSTTLSGLDIKVTTTVGNADNVIIQISDDTFAAASDVQQLETSVKEIKTEILAVKGTCSTLTSDVEGLRSDCESVTARLVQMENNMNLQIQNIQKLISDHLVQAVHGGGGVHGLRYNNDLLQYQDADSWKTIESKYRTMTVRIDLSNRDPETCITYADDALLMTVGDSAWDAFFGHYPVLFKDGTEVGRLDRNNFTQFENGAAADIISGDAGDVMIAFPRRGLQINTVGNILTISMTNDPDNPDFEYLAHTRGNTRKEKFYLGAYKGYTVSSRLRSLSGKKPTSAQKIGTFRTQAQANGAGYEQSSFYQLIFRQAMYLLKYKNLNCQDAVGKGNTNLTSLMNTGSTDLKGMDFGETTGKLQMKLFGLEDCWGNIMEYADGIVTDSMGNVLTATHEFNDNGSGYVNTGQWAATTISGYMRRPQGTVQTGFLPKLGEGSETTYFCDYCTLAASSIAKHGSYYNSPTGGIFSMRVADGASTSNSIVSARLMYL